MFPEITKAIQQRRAQYYLLISEYKFVEKMLKHGQIEQKEADTLMNFIDQKVFKLTQSSPKIQLMDQKNRILKITELLSIFDEEDLKVAFEQENQEKLLEES